MNEQELRVGNWVFDDNKTPMKVVRIDELRYGVWNCDGWGLDRRVVLQGSNGTDDYWESETVEPIPLYHPILEKYRTAHFFVLENDRHFKVDENALLRVVKQQFNGNVWIPVLICEGNEIKLPPVEHLHQLQNLVFALSGKELENNLSL